MADASPNTSSALWATTKLFERSLRQGTQWVGQKVGLAPRVEEDREVDEKVKEFEDLKSSQKEIARLLKVYVEQQRAVKDTERALGMMLSEVGARETRPNMSRCLTDAGRILSQTTVRREGALEASEDFLQQVELYLETAVRDVRDSLSRYDAARRAFRAAEETLASSKSAQQDTARREMLQAEVDAARDRYKHASWQVSQKTLILTLHRNQVPRPPRPAFLSRVLVCALNHAPWTGALRPDLKAHDPVGGGNPRYNPPPLRTHPPSYPLLPQSHGQGAKRPRAPSPRLSPARAAAGALFVRGTLPHVAGLRA